jgi:hypothetical protein
MMSDSQMAPESQGLAKLDIRMLLGKMLPSIIISGAFPVVIYLLASPYMPPLPALALSAVPAILYEVYGWVRTHSIDPISSIVLLMIAVGMLFALLVHDPRIYLIREAFLTGAFGLLSLISLVLPRPISFYAGRYMYAHTPEQIAYYNAGWRLPYVRFATRLFAIVWGLAFLGEALTRTFLVSHLSIAQFLAVSPVIENGTIFAVVAWTITYTSHFHKRWRRIEASLHQLAQEQETRADEGRTVA